jgi:NADPH:quinone reductase-like Zn-dependent oxidoreductase
MKAVVYDRYGSIDRLRIADVPVPRPGAGEVLIEVVATSINLSDWESLHGSPAYARFGGLTRPRRKILGSDIAGRVAAVGDGVTGFAVGDEVFCDNLQRLGGFAEYAVAPADELVHKPAGLSFAEASCLPQAGAIAAQAVARAKDGGRMLLNGAGGGTGMLALQLAAAKGIDVTGVDNAGKLDFMRGLGAREVIDYRAADFTRTGPYDLVIDLVARRSVFAYRRALSKGGTYLMVGGTGRALLRVLVVGGLLGRLTGAHLGILFVRQGPAHFGPVAELAASGAVKVVIDSVFPLEQAPEALARHGEGRGLGKVVVQVRPE